MQEFIALTQLALGQGRAGRVAVLISRQRVAAPQLQPHVQQFRAALARQWPSLVLTVTPVDRASHRVELVYAA